MNLHNTHGTAIEHVPALETVESMKPQPTRRMSMRQVSISILGPITLVMAVALAGTYSGPAELWANVQPVNRDLRIVNAGGPFGNSIVQDITRSSLPEPVARQPAANRDCFQDLALADKDKLERCSRVVYQALIDVEKTVGQPVVSQALAQTTHARVIERLKFAATEVCRSAWAKETVNNTDLNTPACKAAEIQVASDAP